MRDRAAVRRLGERAALAGLLQSAVRLGAVLGGAVLGGAVLAGGGLAGGVAWAEQGGALTLLIDASLRSQRALDGAVPACLPAGSRQPDPAVPAYAGPARTRLQLVQDVLAGTPAGPRWCEALPAEWLQAQAERLAFPPDGLGTRIRGLCCAQPGGPLGCAALAPCAPDSGERQPAEAPPAPEALSPPEGGFIARWARGFGALRFGLLVSEGEAVGPRPEGFGAGVEAGAAAAGAGAATRYGLALRPAPGGGLVALGRGVARLDVGLRGQGEPFGGRLAAPWEPASDPAGELAAHHARLRARIRSIVPHGHSHLSAMLADALEHLGEAPAGCGWRGLVILSDGADPPAYGGEPCALGPAGGPLAEAPVEAAADCGGGRGRCQRLPAVDDRLEEIPCDSGVCEAEGARCLPRDPADPASPRICQVAACRYPDGFPHPPPEVLAAQLRAAGVQVFAVALAAPPEGLARLARVAAAGAPGAGIGGADGLYPVDSEAALVAALDHIASQARAGPVPAGPLLVSTPGLGDRFRGLGGALVVQARHQAFTERDPASGEARGGIAQQLIGCQDGAAVVLADRRLEAASDSAYATQPRVLTVARRGAEGTLSLEVESGRGRPAGEGPRILGAIRQGDRALVRAPTLGLGVPAYRQFRVGQDQRPSLLAAGTATGRLHLLRIGDGSEALSALPWLNREGEGPGAVALDGPLTARTVIACRSLGEARPGCPVQLEPASFRVLLVGGSGGRDLFGLDLTPLTGAVDALGAAVAGAWDVTAGRGPGPPIPRLGQAVARPALTHVRVQDEIRAAVVVGCGDAPEGAGLPADAGRCVLVLDAVSGRPLSEPLTAPGMDAPMIGAPAVFPQSGAAPAERIYLGDRAGRLFRVDLRAIEPEAWVVAQVWPPPGAPAPGRPLAAAPAVAPGELGDPVVVFGHGPGPGGPGALISLTDRAALEPAGLRFAPEVNWRLPLRAREGLIGEPVVAAGVAYALTREAAPAAGACAHPVDRLYGLDYRARAAQPTLRRADDARLEVVPALARLGEQGPEAPALALVLAPGEAAHGLSLTRRPACPGAADPPLSELLLSRSGPAGAGGRQVELPVAGILETAPVAGSLALIAEPLALRICLNCDRDGRPTAPAGPGRDAPFPSQLLFWGSGPAQ